MNNSLDTKKIHSPKFHIFVLGLLLFVPSFAFALPSGTVNQQFLNLSNAWNFSQVSEYHPNSTVRLQCWGSGGDGAPYSRSTGTRRTVVAGVVGSTTYLRDITSYTYGGGFGGGGGGYLEASFKLSDLVTSDTYSLGFREDFNTGGHYNHFKFQKILAIPPYSPRTIFDVIEGRGYDPSMPSLVNNAGGGYIISSLLDSTNMLLSQMGSNGSGAIGITGGAGGLGAGKEYFYPSMASTVGNGGRGTSIASAGPFDVAPAYAPLGLPAISGSPTITQASETGGYGQCVFTTVNGAGGAVNVSSNIATSWKLTPPLGSPFVEIGLTSKPYIHQPLGLYTIEWTVPAGKRIKNQSSNSLQLFDDATINFSVEFEDIGPCPEGYLADSDEVCQPISCPPCAANEGVVGTVCAPIQCPDDQWWNGTACSIGGGGSCGAATSLSFGDTPPAANLCTEGEPINVTLNESTSKYEWMCGANSCNATYAPPSLPGECGLAAGQAFSVAPTVADGLCNAGNPTAVSGSGPWAWTCLGVNGGLNSPTCSASKSAPTGACNANPVCDGAETIFSCPSQCKPKWWQF